VYIAPWILVVLAVVTAPLWWPWVMLAAVSAISAAVWLVALPLRVLRSIASEPSAKPRELSHDERRARIGGWCLLAGIAATSVAMAAQVLSWK
jgi:hypothetical protein